MGHEAIISGRIVGASWQVGERFRWTHDLNRVALAALPENDDWPWVVRGIFALPAPYPARATVGVAALPKGAAVEADAILVLD